MMITDRINVTGNLKMVHCLIEAGVSTTKGLV